MKKVLTTLIVSLISPLIVFAAYDDVQIPSGTTLVLSVAGNNLEFTVNSGLVQSLNVNASSLDITLAPGSAISVNSANRRTFNYQVNRAIASVSCTSDISGLGVSLASSEPSNETVTITPTNNTCTAESGGAGGGSGGGGGGGGGGSSAPATPATPAVPADTSTQPATPATPAEPATPSSAAQPSPVALLVSPVFNQDLAIGSRGDDVKRLQELLAQDKTIYPEGLATGYYGNLTVKAVRAFQEKYGLPSVGRVGPATRAKLQEVFGGSAAPAAPTAPASAPAASPAPAAKSQSEQLQDLLKQLQDLQSQLNAQQGY